MAFSNVMFYPAENRAVAKSCSQRVTCLIRITDTSIFQCKLANSLYFNP